MAQKKPEPLVLLAQMIAQMEADRDVEKPVVVKPIVQGAIYSGGN